MCKKVLCMLLAISMIFTVAISSVQAANSTLTITAGEIVNGEVTVKVALTNNQGADSIAFSVAYDNTKLVPKAATANAYGTNPALTNFSTATTPELQAGLTEVTYFVYGLTPLTVNGDLLEITFTVKDGNWAKAPLTFGYSELTNGDTLPTVDTAAAEIVLPQTPDFTLRASEVTYNGTEASLVATDVAEGVNITYANNNKVDAGTYTVTATGKKPYCAPLEKKSTLKINPAPLTVSGLTVLDKTYDGNNNATISSVGTLAGKVGSDDVSIDTALSKATYASANASASAQAVALDLKLTGAKKGNYTVSNPTGVIAKINPLTINVTSKNAGKTTNKPDPQNLEYTFSPALIGSSAFTGNLVRATGESAGTYDINQGTLVIGPDAGNYKINYTKGAFTIVDKIAQTIAVKDVEAKTYGDDNFELEVSPDSASGLTAYTYTSNNDEVVTVDAEGVVTIVGAGNAIITVTEPGNSTYAEGSDTVEITVNKKELTVDATAADKSYDGTNAAEITFNALEGVVGSDAVELVNMPKVGTFDNANADEGKAVTLGVTLTLTGADANNYTVVTPTDITADINKVELTVAVKTSATDDTITYGDALPTFTVDYTGFVNSETAAVISNAAKIDDSAVKIEKVIVGEYEITADGAEATNYTFVYVPATLTVDAKEITITALEVLDKAKDGTTDAKIVSNTLATSAIVNGDEVIVDLANAVAKFTDAERGQDKAVAITGIALSGADADNYTIASTYNTTGDIVSAAAVAEGLSAFSLEQDAQTVALPNVDSDFQIAIKTTDNEAVIGTDGFVAPVAANTVVNVTFIITNKNYPEDTAVSSAVAVTVVASSTVTITATATPSSMGTVLTSDTALKNGNTTVTATPTPGYMFYGWFIGDELKSGDLEYTFKATTNTALVGKFGEIPSSGRRPSSGSVSVTKPIDPKPVDPVDPTPVDPTPVTPGTTTDPIVPSSDNIVLTIGSTNAYIKGKLLVMDVKPKINADGRTLMPARFISEALGADVKWNEADRTVSIVKDAASIKLTIGSNIAVINGSNVTLDTSAIIDSSRTLVPIRAIAEALGGSVVWNETEERIKIIIESESVFFD